MSCGHVPNPRAAAKLPGMLEHWSPRPLQSASLACVAYAGDVLCRLTSIGYISFKSSVALKYSYSSRSLMLHVPCLSNSCSQKGSFFPAEETTMVRH